MKKSLGFISISHKTASVTQREIYQISDDEKNSLTHEISKVFPDITGLLMLITCNRTEIYFESSITKADSVCDFFISQKGKGNATADKRLFDLSDKTEVSVKHLLEVAAGLESSVLGDAEIIHQFKKAHLFSLAQKMQGSILERAMQTVFKCHKRISNETHFRDGTTSIAYKSLKLVSEHLRTTSKEDAKILFIGAGDITTQLFKYNSKFKFKNIYLSNRTEERAEAIAEKESCSVFDWNKVMANDLEDFDVIISAVSNRHHLIKDIEAENNEMLLIDLAVPTNIDKSLAKNKNVSIYGIDCISKELESNMESRLKAIDLVTIIIAEELSDYMAWLQKASFRATLAKQKRIVVHKIRNYFETDREEYSQQLMQVVTNRVIKKIIKRKNASMSLDEMDSIIFKQLTTLKETFN